MGPAVSIADRLHVRRGRPSLEPTVPSPVCLRFRTRAVRFAEGIHNGFGRKMLPRTCRKRLKPLRSPAQLWGMAGRTPQFSFRQPKRADRSGWLRLFWSLIKSRGKAFGSFCWISRGTRPQRGRGTPGAGKSIRRNAAGFPLALRDRRACQGFSGQRHRAFALSPDAQGSRSSDIRWRPLARVSPLEPWGDRNHSLPSLLPM